MDSTPRYQVLLSTHRKGYLPIGIVPRGDGKVSLEHPPTKQVSIFKIVNEHGVEGFQTGKIHYLQVKAGGIYYYVVQSSKGYELSNTPCSDALSFQLNAEDPKSGQRLEHGEDIVFRNVTFTNSIVNVNFYPVHANARIGDSLTNPQTDSEPISEPEFEEVDTSLGLGDRGSGKNIVNLTSSNQKKPSTNYITSWEFWGILIFVLIILAAGGYALYRFHRANPEHSSSSTPMETIKNK